MGHEGVGVTDWQQGRFCPGRHVPKWQNLPAHTGKTGTFWQRNLRQERHVVFICRDRNQTMWFLDCAVMREGQGHTRPKGQGSNPWARFCPFEFLCGSGFGQRGKGAHVSCALLRAEEGLQRAICGFCSPQGFPVIDERSDDLSCGPKPERVFPVCLNEFDILEISIAPAGVFAPHRII